MFCIHFCDICKYIYLKFFQNYLKGVAGIFKQHLENLTFGWELFSAAQNETFMHQFFSVKISIFFFFSDFLFCAKDNRAFDKT